MLYQKRCSNLKTSKMLKTKVSHNKKPVRLKIFVFGNISVIFWLLNKIKSEDYSD